MLSPTQNRLRSSYRIFCDGVTGKNYWILKLKTNNTLRSHVAFILVEQFIYGDGLVLPSDK